MRKFYFYAQLVAVLVAPNFLIFSPVLLGLPSSWPSDISMIVLGVILLLGLTLIAWITHRTALVSGVKELPVRLAVLLETIYVAVVALLLTAGAQNQEGQQSAVVSILIGQGAGEDEAWFVNEIARMALLTVIFFFLTVALFSATKEKIGLTHRTISRYEILSEEELLNENYPIKLSNEHKIVILNENPSEPKS